jgi:Putative Flp pilus-assembly TadE/G-like
MNRVLRSVGRKLSASRGSHEAGQILPIFALVVIALFGMAALAIDVSRAYADLRLYRATADEASLAGAQDLQIPGSRGVSSAEYTRARNDALRTLEQRLGGSGAACNTTADIVDCPISGTPMVVSIKTPSPSCSSCDPARAVQVTVRNPNYGLTFARVLGSRDWDVGTTSVSGLTFGKSFAVVTLRPPKKLGSAFDVKNITIGGGSIVTVHNGDVGSNSNMDYEGGGSILNLTSGYNMYYFPAPPPDDDPGWFPTPVGVIHPLLFKDPLYRYPLMAGSLGTAASHTFSTANKTDCRDGTAHASTGTALACTRADHDPSCELEARTKVPAAYDFMTAQLLDLTTIYCYNPGIYDTNNSNQLKVGTGDLAILKPGAYYFKSGLDVSGRLIGGYEAGSKGVALMFDECSSQCIFAGNNALTVSLNAGSKFPATATSGTAATAAHDWDDQLVQTSGPDSPTPPLPLTVLVKYDTNDAGSQGCLVPTTAPFVEPSACDANHNQTINIAGNGQIILEGVQYAPTDNAAITGGSSSDGRVGQIISWTLKYSGGIEINQEGPATERNGVLRIDAACSLPGDPGCHP